MKLLFLTSRFPYPLEKGDKLRAYYLIKSLSKYADIYLFAVNNKKVSEDQLNALSPYCKAIETGIIPVTDSVFSVLKTIPDINFPFQVSWFYQRRVMEQLKSFTAKHNPDAVFCHLIRMAEYARNLNIQNSVLDYMDTLSQGMERISRKSNFPKNIATASEAKRLATYEKKSMKWFKHHTIISTQDRDWLPVTNKNEVEIIPNGVDPEFYHPLHTEKKYDLVFAGNMNYEPNINSATFLAKQILPSLKPYKKDISLVIAGANPSPKVKSLASDKIHITGWVEDIRKVMASATVMVAPMLISTGLQNKILQAMAMKIPCVISVFANNALNAPPDECVLVAGSSEEFAIQINRLLSDELLRQRIAENAFHFIRKNFIWDEQAQKIMKLLDQ